MQPLPRDFLTKVAQEYNLTEEQQEAFVERFSSNKNEREIAETIPISHNAFRTRMTGVYNKFSISGKGPGKARQLHDFLIQKHQKSHASTIPEPSHPAIDIELLVQQAREMIRADIQDRCDTMRVLDMSRPIGLEDIYTPVKILKTITEHRRKPITESLQDCNAGEGKPEPGLEAIKTYPDLKLIIWGKPGAGKTTFLQHLAIQCLEDKFFENRIPIFITLKDFAKEADKPRLLEYMLKRYNYLSLREILESGKALVLLDGLDEVREQDSDRVREEIGKFCDHNQFRDNHFVITCRIAAQQYKKYRFKKFTEVEMADFEPAQISDFANKWFKNIDGESQNFIDKLDKNRRIKDLATNPLLLTLLCLVFEELKDFPANRSKLYEECVDLLLKRWDEEQDINRGSVYKKLSFKHKKDLLSQIALTTFEDGDLEFKQKKVERYITDYIHNLPGANTDEEVLQLDSEAVLRSIEAQHGLLIKLDKETYSFSHLTFHEYFTAREIIINKQSSEEALQKLVSHLTDRQWREVFLLAAGMSLHADRLLLLMKHEAEHLIPGCKRLEQILDWVNNQLVLGSEWNVWDKLYLISGVSSWLYSSESGPLESESGLFEGNEIFSIGGHNKFLLITLPFTMVVLVFSKILAEDIVLEFADDLYRGFVKLPETLKESLIAGVGTGDILGLWQSWLKKLEINNILETIEVINVSEYINSPEEVESVERYYNASQLLLDCLSSDCYVSREVREEIEETLLLPIAEIEKRKIEKQKRQSQ